ncbi:hypothetical protein CERSUDRAFT_96090 [Gelatoporia subvermispora B]|uniref:Sodium/calcium exchanger membrane region domain-containing protein n=1 Tax=Ceriporiopsis subvermispora (strain B) TaxID=914234 RepID=M2QUW7_CERS8|nr:hypothetical protein CERSUDRAFT_96090 [Gelatoporia subvermispora B]
MATDPEKALPTAPNADNACNADRPEDTNDTTTTVAQFTRLFYTGRTEWLKERWNFVMMKGNNPRRSITVMESIRNIFTSSVVNVLLLFIPFAWASHFHGAWGHTVTYSLCFLSIVPLETMYDWGGEQMVWYLGTELGDLLIVTLNNAVEATLAIILLAHCELRLLQSTITGVIILHLLLVPGTAFLTGGMQKWEQGLTEHTTQLNHSLLLLGIMAILLPTALFAALDRGVAIADHGQFEDPVSDHTRGEILKMSRGLSVLILIVYILSRVFVHTSDPPNASKSSPVNPGTQEKGSGGYHPGQSQPSGSQKPGVPHRTEVIHTYPEHEDHGKGNANVQLQDTKTSELTGPQVGPGACLMLLATTVGIMAATAEFLVESIEFVRVESDIEEEWFGLILLPIASFAADGTVAVFRFGISVINHITRLRYREPQDFAQARAIDLSIQFVLFWMPLLVLLGWWTGKPMNLMFDYFELALLLGSCFLVNYVTADAKTNWIEGLIMMTLYMMIAICAWFYVAFRKRWLKRSDALPWNDFAQHVFHAAELHICVQSALITPIIYVMLYL